MKKYQAIEQNGRMYVMKPGGTMAICITAKFDVVSDPKIVREEAKHIAHALNSYALLAEAEVAVAQLCEGQHQDNECWNILGKIRAAIAEGKAA